MSRGSKAQCPKEIEEAMNKARDIVVAALGGSTVVVVITVQSLSGLFSAYACQQKYVAGGEPVLTLIEQIASDVDAYMSKLPLVSRAPRGQDFGPS